MSGRDAKARKILVRSSTVFDLSCLSEAASRIENAMAWHNDEQYLEESFGDVEEDDDGHDGEQYPGEDIDDEEEPVYVTGVPPDNPELREQFDGDLDDAESPTTQVHATATRRLQDARELLTRHGTTLQWSALVHRTARHGPLEIGRPQRLEGQATNARSRVQEVAESREGLDPTSVTVWPSMRKTQ